MAVMGIDQFQRFFRVAADLEVDKEDIKRFDTFVDGKIEDLLLLAQATAKANLRDVIEPWDLPITKGLQECIHAFRKTDEALELTPILERIATVPMLDMALGADTEQRMPELAGGISMALGRSFKLVDPDLKNPGTEEWERAFQLFDLLL